MTRIRRFKIRVFRVIRGKKSGWFGLRLGRAGRI